MATKRPPRKCKSCPRDASPRSGWCWGHRMMKQSAGAQAEAASDRLADHVGPIRKKAPVGLVQPGERWCPSCQSSLPDFYFTGARCKGCVSRAAHDARVEKVYGITGEEYADLLKAQGGRCFICQNKPARVRLAVDHDHKTGAVRGLLCKRCNRDLLGAAHDGAEILYRAIAYLEDPPAQIVLQSKRRKQR